MSFSQCMRIVYAELSEELKDSMYADTIFSSKADFAGLLGDAPRHRLAYVEHMITKLTENVIQHIHPTKTLDGKYISVNIHVPSNRIKLVIQEWPVEYDKG